MARVSIWVSQMNQKQRSMFLNEIDRHLKDHFSGLTTLITGFEYLVHETTQRIMPIQIQSFALALLIITIVLFFVFGFRGGLISIVPNILPVLFLLGFMGYFGFLLSVATAIIASIAIGIVVDDTIHYFHHYRCELRQTGNGEQAMKNAHRSVGGALCSTTVILVLGFLIFTLSETKILINFGILSAVAITVALWGDLILGPVLLLKWKAFKKETE
jgi:predicted RND superfamily exporter protein